MPSPPEWGFSHHEVMALCLGLLFWASDLGSSFVYDVCDDHVVYCRAIGTEPHPGTIVTLTCHQVKTEQWPYGNGIPWPQWSLVKALAERALPL